MKGLHLHPTVRTNLHALIANTPSSLVFHGVSGVGLYTIAHSFALDITTEHNIITMEPDEKGTIKIDEVRKLYGQTRARRVQKLVIIIDDSDAMQAAAQNALLKLLEETPPEVMFVLTTHSPQQLLPTIRSRLQETVISPLDEQHNTQLLTDIGVKDRHKQAQLVYLAGGLPAEIIRLTEDEDYFISRSEEIRDARDFLSARLYEKLVISHKLAGDRAKALQLLHDAMRIVETNLKRKPEASLALMLKNLLLTQQKLLNDSHVRTQLLRLATKVN